jgi:biotin operon repressor
MKQLNEKYHYTVPWRMSNFLLDIADIFGEKIGTKTKLTLKLSHQFISAALNINRVTAAKNTKKMKELGLIEFFNDYYYIADIPALIKYRDENMEYQ